MLAIAPFERALRVAWRARPEIALYRPRTFALSCCTAILLLACATPKNVYRTETFTPGSPFEQRFAANASATCEGARRTLLSQGYVVTSLQQDRITASKAFQPNDEEHITIDFTVSCITTDETIATAYANAVQTRYQLKTTPNSFGLSAPLIGALSLPFGTRAENLVKTGAATITDAEFYARFWSLMAVHVEPLLDDPGR